MKRSISDNVPLAILNTANIDVLTVRQCKVDDVQSIARDSKFSLAQTERFWTREFLTADNALRNGYVLDASGEIFGFCFYEKAEALDDYAQIEEIADIKELKLRDLSISRSTEIEVDCKWNVSDWNGLQNASDKNVRFYSAEFILISELGIYEKHSAKGYGPKLLQAIIFSFPSGTRFGAEIEHANNAQIECFGKAGFVIARHEKNVFFMALVSEYTADDVLRFKKESKVRHRANVIEELKKSKISHIAKHKNKNSEEKQSKNEGDDEIFVAHNISEEKEAKNEKKSEFSPAKLNRLCSELCCVSDSQIIECILRILRKVIDDRSVRLDFALILCDFERALPANLDRTKYVQLAL